MTTLVQAPWLAVVVPVLLAGWIALLGSSARRTVPFIAALAPVLVILVGAGSLVGLPAGEAAPVEPWTSALASQGSVAWFEIGATSFRIGWAVDSLAAIMLLVVGVVALMVMIFSAGYMAGDEGWGRYYALLSLFTGSMTLLVIGDSFTSLFIGWELVGACSYLLIGFWYREAVSRRRGDQGVSHHARGDVGLLLGIAVLWVGTGSSRLRAGHGEARDASPCDDHCRGDSAWRWAPSASQRSSRFTSGSPTRWKVRRLSQRSSTLRRWSRLACI